MNEVQATVRADANAEPRPRPVYAPTSVRSRVVGWLAAVVVSSTILGSVLALFAGPDAGSGALARGDATPAQFAGSEREAAISS